MLNQQTQTDALIIGAGPTGLFAAFEAGMLGMESIICDVLDVPGGQCSVLYPQKPIYDIPAIAKINGQELTDALIKQNSRFKPKFLLARTATQINGSAGNYQVTFDDSSKVNCKVIIIATGSGLFGPNRPPLNGIEECEGKSVLYYVSDRQKFAGKTLVIAGGGDSAIDWAISLAELAKRIYVVHRRDKFRAHPASIEQLYELSKTPKIEVVTPYQLAAIKHSNGYLNEVIISDLENNERSLRADFLLPFFGLKAELGPIANWQLNLAGNHIIVNPNNMMTNKEGIYAIGDVCTYPGKLKLILTGFSEGALACHSAYKFVSGGKDYHFEYSTTKFNQ